MATDTYTTNAPPGTRAFALFYIDRYPMSFIARQLEVTEAEVARLIEVEAQHRRRVETFPLSIDRPDRGHEKVGAQDKVCDFHGPYVSELWRLKSLPKGVSAPIPPSLSQFWSNCPTCDRFMQDEANRRDAEIKCATHNRDELRRAAKREANIPERYMDAQMMNWVRAMDTQHKVWRWCMDFCSSFDIALQSGRSVMLCGGTGTGKTRLAVSMATHVIDKGGTAYYSTATSLLERVKDTFGSAAKETTRDAVEWFRSRDLLVIDEVGKQNDSNYDQSQLFHILDLRYQSCRPTVIVSNLSKAGLLAFLGAPVLDRLREAGGGLLEFTWSSQRSARAPKAKDGDA